MTAPDCVLVVGARENSLGDLVAKELGRRRIPVVTCGQSDENQPLDATDVKAVKALYERLRPSHVLCTVGVNDSRGLAAGDLYGTMLNSFGVNVIAPLVLLRAAVEIGAKQFVAISSNSAHIARRGSIPYCASKSALSMALRCAAREVAGDPTVIYGYEPGLLSGTPMTEATEKQFGAGSMGLHRMQGVGPHGLDTVAFACQVVDNLCGQAAGLNGVMLRIDAGEQ